jgi:hypothetical protein
MNSDIFPSRFALENVQGIFQNTTLNVYPGLNTGAAVANFLNTERSDVWTILDELVEIFLQSNSNVYTNLNVVITTLEGTVAYDSSSQTNTYADFLTKTINENHNTRSFVINALLGKEGTGYCLKFNSTQNKYTGYNATRIGPSPEFPIGCAIVYYTTDNSN